MPPTPTPAPTSLRRLTARSRAARAVLGAVAAGAAVFTAAAPAAVAAPAATELCGTYDSTSVDGGRYIVQNNAWGASTPQCISVDGTSFEVTRAEHNNPTNGAPAGYPSIYAGCHYGNCTTGSGLPLRVDAMNKVTSNWSTTSPAAGVYDVAYDIWFDPTPSAAGQNAGELMIWQKYRGPVQPIGSRVATTTIGGVSYDVWTGNIGWNVISYVRTTPADSVTGLDVRAFADDAANRGSIQRSWFLNSVQAGFEPWQGGVGLRTGSFSVEVS
ncbi:GH12 family glycosyl hydrolase domain-containing protein [Streptomyces sp. NBC_00344]|uniref:GH12 family glycosyl hydrolase domain-containing protein n=1 Tax=Streptomyces sp. NBC_00344 TaxID=2975720 RepID=UPI002E23E5E6